LAFCNYRCLVSFALAVGVVTMWNLHHLILRNLLLLSYYRCLLKVSVSWLKVFVSMSIKDLSLFNTTTIRISWILSLLSSEKQKSHFKQMNG
jgi:hypothetical protein